MRKLIVALAALAVWYVASGGYEQLIGVSNDRIPGATGQQSTFSNSQSGDQVMGTGTVIRVLSDDNDGNRHQRFVLELASGQTLLIAHNIDLAPRVPSIGKGDSVRFFGVYEWNSNGGVVHWTHHDPNGRHVAGWLKHGGRTYQ